MDISFFKNGLRFQCQRCSRCCRIDPGYVFLTESDLAALLLATGSPRDRFLKEYCRWVPMNGYQYLSLKEKQNYDCILWEGGGCSVYEYRPIQCRSYPFWETFLLSVEQWENLKASCPGVGLGTLHSLEEINNWIQLRNSSPYIRIPNRKGVGR